MKHFLEYNDDDFAAVAPKVILPITITDYAFRGGVYFIRHGQFVKIGISTDIRVRLNHMRVGTPEQLELLAFIPCRPDDARRNESRLHQTFKDEHYKGEWFSLSNRLRCCIAIEQLNLELDSFTAGDAAA